MNEVIETADVKRCVAMVGAVMSARSDARFGQIVGPPGTGKTLMSKYLSDQNDGVRVCASAGCKPVGMLNRIARSLGQTVTNADGSDKLQDILSNVVKGRAIFVDEANHLDWLCLESLRYIADEGGAGVVLLGTPILDDEINDGRRKTYFDQLRRRVGAKRVQLSLIKSHEEITQHIIQPRFGPVTKTLARHFLKGSRGDWGTGLELANACLRIMDNEKKEKLDEDIVIAASQYLAA